MSAHLTKLRTAQAVGGLVASLLASSWTLSRWGVTETLCGVAPVLFVLACVAAILGALVLVAWVGRRWGAGNTLRGVAPWLVAVACVSVTLASLAVLAAALQTSGWAVTLCTVTCLVWLLDFSVRRSARLWKHLRQRGGHHDIDTAGGRGPRPVVLPSGFRAGRRPGGTGWAGLLDANGERLTAGAPCPGNPRGIG
jgi:hypothetical protein